VYKQSFSCKINSTKVKQTATKLHKSPDKTSNERLRFHTPGENNGKENEEEKDSALTLTLLGRPTYTASD